MTRIARALSPTTTGWIAVGDGTSHALPSAGIMVCSPCRNCAMRAASRARRAAPSSPSISARLASSACATAGGAAVVKMYGRARCTR
jgi:hypothetical protein